MIGAIAGDVIGSVHEFRPLKTTDFPLFTAESTYTDDTVLTVATAAALLDGGDYPALYRRWGLRYPDLGYGSMFRQWLRSPDLGPYGSCGNGSAMRVSPVGWAFDTLDDVLREAERSARATHDHPEGIKGAQAAAGSVFLARTGAGKEGIRDFASSLGYDLGRTLDEIRPGCRFDGTCQGSVPESLLAFLESEGYEDAVRKAVSLGGDADTMACIAGGVAEAFYGGVPEGIRAEVLRRLPVEVGALAARFEARFGRDRARVYFAYGSNMSSGQMAVRCPGAAVLGTATLSGYRFHVNDRGVATVLADPAAAVHGVLWSLTGPDEARLDRYEGVAEGFYAKEGLAVTDAGGRTVQALVYVARDREPGRPRRGYLRGILEAAAGHGLPAAYVAELRRWGQGGDGP